MAKHTQLKCNEVRIGNIALDATFNTTRIERIDESNFPIRYGKKLTKKWLEAIGFSTDGFPAGQIGFYSMPFSFTLRMDYLGDEEGNYPGLFWRYYASDAPRFIQLVYVHELQNLYFVVTGRELKIP